RDFHVTGVQTCALPISYFIVNGTDDRVSGWVPVQTEAIAAALYDPMRGTSGLARTRPADTGGLEVYLQLDAGASAILQASRTPQIGRASGRERVLEPRR